MFTPYFLDIPCHDNTSNYFYNKIASETLM